MVSYASFFEFPFESALETSWFALSPAAVDLRNPVELVAFVTDRTVKPFLLLRVEVCEQAVVVNTGAPFFKLSRVQQNKTTCAADLAERGTGANRVALAINNYSKTNVRKISDTTTLFFTPLKVC